jgi:hypothetical protein
MSSSTSPSVPSSPTLPTQSFRLDVPLHNLLQKDPSPTLARVEHQPRTSLALPSPVFPRYPALLHKIDDANIAAHQGVLAGLRRK